MALKAQNTISGKEGRLFLDGEEMAHIKTFEANVEKNKSEVNIMFFSTFASNVLMCAISSPSRNKRPSFPEIVFCAFNAILVYLHIKNEDRDGFLIDLAVQPVDAAEKFYFNVEVN